MRAGTCFPSCFQLGIAPSKLPWRRACYHISINMRREDVGIIHHIHPLYIFILHWDVILIIIINIAMMMMIFWDLLGASEPTRDWTLELLFDWDTPTT